MNAKAALLIVELHARHADIRQNAVKLLSNCRQERQLCYVWDGSAIVTIYEKSLFEP